MSLEHAKEQQDIAPAAPAAEGAAQDAAERSPEMCIRDRLTTQQLFEFRWNRSVEALGIEADGVSFEKRFLDLLYEKMCIRDRSSFCSRVSARIFFGSA